MVFTFVFRQTKRASPFFIPCWCEEILVAGSLILNDCFSTIYLGLNPDRLVTIQEIADAYGISKNHLMKVAHQLGLQGLRWRQHAAAAEA